jgi:hypothetical protein
MRVTKWLARPRGDDERGATAVIVTLTLIALLGMIILTVDVGQLLYKRRAMVNASDAAALAAAQSCAGLKDSDNPGAMANAFAVDNVSVASGGITNVVGCDGPAFGHVTVQYQMQQGLFFAGVLGFDGPAAVRTEATAGWGPTKGGNPVPIVVYEGNGGQGSCPIVEDVQPGVTCYLWYDNDMFLNSSFGFLNLCTVNDSCSAGWDVGGGVSCPNVGSSLRSEWIAGTWRGGPNETNFPNTTFVCRVGGLASSDWRDLEARLSSQLGSELMFPVNDCFTQVDKNGVAIGCTPTAAPDKYNIIGFIVLRLEAIYDSAAEWGGTGLSSCSKSNFDVTTGTTYPLSSVSGGGCPGPSTPSGAQNFKINGQSSSPNWIYDATNKRFTWTGAPGRVQVAFDWWIDGQCGRPPNNSSAVCIKVTTVEAQFRGHAICEACADFGLRAVRLCDLAIGSCPEDTN